MEALLHQRTPSASVKSGKRIAYIDLMEALSMLFVVSYHLSNLYYKVLDRPLPETYINYFLRNIFVCCVPLFLLTNGYLMFHHSLDLKKHLKKVVRYVLLTLFWGICTLLVYNQVYDVPMSIGSFLDDLLTWRDGVIHLWYMGALVIIYLLFPLLKLVHDKNRKLLVYFVGVIAVVTFGNTLINHALTILTGLRGKQLGWVLMENWFSMFNPVAEIPGYTLVYFCLGAFLQDFLGYLNKFNRRRVNLIAAGCLAVALAVHSLWFVLLCKACTSYICSIWYGYETITGVLITACMVVLLGNYRGTWTPGQKLLQHISSNTLGIYFMHMLLVHPLRLMLLQIPFLCNLPANLLSGAAIVLLCTGVSLLLRRIPLLKQLVS